MNKSSTLVSDLEWMDGIVAYEDNIHVSTETVPNKETCHPYMIPKIYGTPQDNTTILDNLNPDANIISQ